ncbi:type I polyketide synthase [Paenibacillus alvei]|uniref:type I polyketide synthase n=1 Tax=Paenibacillus alvei TaxID=44250 RepID=UPI000386871D|nr:SDR family NAD(P)-dependent oxidoreductase [Paenibacillus alvei]EPY14024.1 beta-ketoacyl synthase [Paenibacillus alvei A6-6i-x]
MEKAYKYVIESVKEKKIDRQAAIQLIKLLENEKTEDVYDIAIIGVALKLPSAETLEDYWKVIENGIDCISDFPESRKQDITNYLSSKGLSSSDIAYSKAAYLSDIDNFDYKFFKFSPREASLMDPCQRIFLELSWKAIENAGYGGKKLEGTNTGVYVGYAGNLRDMYGRLVEELDPEGLSIAMVGNLTAVIPSRISYLLDLKGPNMVIDTACSSSLVSIHMACKALINKECDYAIAGGININTVPLDKEYMKTGIESSDGVSRTFDNQSDGSGIGEGLGVVLLKPLTSALKDKDHIYAVIKGSAINQDGRSAGITAPNPRAQTDVIVKSWENAGVDPRTISYIETHGTGTNLGDPIEIQGIHSAFQQFTNNKQFCAVSSVKTNIGHLSEAAGIVSVIKSVIALNKKQIPPSIHFNVPNRSINFEESSVYVNTKIRPWTKEGYPRRCGVSSFGISGTNCHIVIEEAPDREFISAQGDYPCIFALSAKSKEALLTLASAYVNFLDENNTVNLEEICYTANSGRGHYLHRLFLLPESVTDLREMLEDFCLYDGEQFSSYRNHRIVSLDKHSRENTDITEGEREKLNIKLSSAMQALRDHSSPKKSLLQQIGELYLRGADVNWEILTEEDKPYKIPLPSYPFARDRCWVKNADHSFEHITAEKDTKYLYSINWITEHLPLDQENMEIDDVLVIKDESDHMLTQSLVTKLRMDGIRVVEAVIGRKFDQLNNESFIISNQAEDYQKLIEYVNSQYNISHILHMSALGNKEIHTLEQLSESQNKGVYSLFHLTQAMLKKNNNRNTALIIFTQNLHSANGEEPVIHPEFSTLSGLGKVLSQEYSHIICKAVDIDDSTTIDPVILELSQFTKQYQCAYREGMRYVEEFGPLNDAYNPPNKLEIKTTGVYIISGGTGGIGLETAKYLASQNNAHIALINRTGFPDKQEWESIRENGIQQDLIKKIDFIKEIESMGSKIVLVKADVSNYAEMSNTIQKLRNDYGRINGIFHGAGVAGAGYLYNKDFKIFEGVLKPKVTGTWILDKLTQEDELDFFVMQSSGVSLVGEAGQGDYVAGNAYLDSFAAYRRKNHRHALSVNWVSWKETGMSVQFGINVDSIFKAIPTQQAIRGLDRALSSNLSRVLIGEVNEDPKYSSLFHVLPFNLTKEMREHHENLRSDSQEDISVITNGTYDAAIVNKGRLIILPKGKNTTRRATQKQAVSLKGKQVGEYSELEVQIADIYSNILGYDEIDINDNFFELGGDSMLLSKVHVSLEKLFPGKIRMLDLFEHTSIYKLCQFLSQETQYNQISMNDNSSGEVDATSILEEETERMFDEIERGNLSIEEATKQFMLDNY